MGNDIRDGLTVIPGGLDNGRPKAMNGSIVLTPKRKVSEEELEKAENELRARAKDLFKRIETTYWELGQALYEVYDGVPGGYRDLMKGDGSRAARKALFEKWGYASFEEYCEKEIGILRRSAQNLRYAYYWFEINLMLPTELKEQIKSLGRSKVYLLSGFVDNDNIMGWVDKARQMTHEKLKKEIKTAKAEKADKNKDGEEGGVDINDAMGDDDERKVAPAPEEMHTLQAGLFEPQWKTWEAAFDRAKNISGSDKIGHNLELICQDFLANNDFTKPEEDIKAYCAKIERHLGKKLIVIDPGSGSPVYGADLLWMLVKEGGSRAEAGEDGNGEGKKCRRGKKDEDEVPTDGNTTLF